MPSFSFCRSLHAILLSYLLVFSFAPTATVARSTSPPRLAHRAQERPLAPNRDGELLVRFRAGVPQLAKDTIIATQGARSRKPLTGESGVEKVELPAGRNVRTAALELLLNPQVEFAEPNFLIAKDDLRPNDPQFDNQWALRNTGQTGGQYGSDINATGAWQTITGSPATVIAVIDSGIDFTHQDLTHNQWINPRLSESGDLHGWDFVDDSGEIKDEQGHGTAVAGIIAAEGNNSLGITGVMWRASLMSVRVLDNTGTGDVADAVEAIDYAVAHGAQVINLSWGTGGESVALKDAIERAIRRNVVVVCSAGNGGRDIDASPYYPASSSIRNLVSVAATDSFDQLPSWSNWGARSVTVAAPGTNILTTQRGGGYWGVTGTSAAAPIVSGIAGLLRTTRPQAPASIVVKAISDGVRPMVSLAGKVSSGGIANAAEALSKLHSTNLSLPLPTPGYGSGGTGPGGSFSTTPPPMTHGARAANLPNLDELRKTQPAQPKTKAPIESNLPCADCDPQGGGGGGGYYPPSDPNFSTARGRPINETGQPGVDLGSRNFNWSLPILSLPGRAGLDLNLTLSYNSLVWTKDGSYMKFNADLGSPAPGFRIGLPTLQQRFFNSQTNIYAYIMVLPSGGRVELRQVGTSTIYESRDSSYTQLDATDVNFPVLRTTDGTQYTFTRVTIDNEYRCKEIKDRNGNYISATYDSATGHLLTMTDTLGRVITFVYDSNANLQAIRQTWAGVAHDWATFYYGQVYVAPGFGGGLIVNGPNNNYTAVLTQVNLHDGTYFTFYYNAAFAQVNRINRYAADGHLRSYTSYNVSSASGQTECPRFTEQRDWAENWNNGNEAVTSFSVAADGSYTQETTPDGTIYKEFFAISGWQTGLTTSTEIWSGGVKKKWTTISWTQDDTGLSYQKNPRVTETNIYDAEGNRRRTTINYGPYASYSLPYEVIEYAADGTTMLRRTYTDYNLDSSYTSRRIIGLVSAIHVVDHATESYVSKTTFEYDWGGEYLAATPQTPIRHDTTNYGSGFVTGRGNLSTIWRWDVTDINNVAKAIPQNRTGYNTTGSTIFSRDALGHQTSINYADVFSDQVNRNAFAYPTSMTDADGFSSTAEYAYDFGAVTRTHGAPPAGQSQGLIQTFAYDAAARLERATAVNTGAYTRYVYGPYYMQSFSSVNNVADDAYSCQVFDGAGRITAESAFHPGSTGGYIGKLTTYDVMGRAIQQTNPTEISEAWAPVGDDAAWVYTVQAYDWKGRPTLTTFPDGATRENTYGGCGCAGGEVTTVRDERGRRRKLTMDVLGRLKQLDELNWDQSVYATTTYSYNVADQLTQINQAGQIRSFAYQGHGRLQTRTTPEQGATSYSYFANDSVQTITDARGAAMTFSYNNRNLVTGISFGVPAGVAATPNVTFGYDAAANRTSMSDGLGSVSYGYDQLSRVTSETRTFTGLGSYALSYAYNLAGEVTSITNPWGVQVGYSYDSTGRPTSVSGSGYAGVSSYVSSMSYRAFGLKQMGYSNGRTLSLQYDNRLRVTQWNVSGVMGWNYAYNYFGENTGRATYAQNLYDATLDRSYDYDQVGRLIEARTASEARGHLIGQGGTQDGPYAHSYRYDQTGNMWYRVGWGGWFNPWLEQWPNYVNNRLTTNPWTGATMSYDAAGNLTNDGYQSYTYDATGQQTSASATALTQSYDGDGLRVKKVESGVTAYYVRSSVLGGQVVCELNSAGTWWRGYVYLGNQLLALQYGNAVSWVHQDPVTKSQRLTNSSGTVTSTIDLDPWGGETSRSSNQTSQPHRYTSYERDGDGGDEAMMRRYNGKWHRFMQPDPSDGSYDLTNPQSFNRYTYVQNDPANLVDPSGLDPQDLSTPSPTTHIDPATGQPTSVPGISASVTISFSQVFGPGSALGGDSHEQLLVVLLRMQKGGGGAGSQGPATQAKKSEPTPEGIRMGKLVDCLEDAKRWYEKVTEETRREYDSLFLGPVALGTTALSGLLGGINGVIGGIAGRAIVGGVYHIGRELGNARGYRNLVENCYRQWGNR
ncbi:MAG TPA: S8 family serine peptidase [Pyrinomonadaceae bacterium]|nr:S8 family serine peptidase [Pyrinomonadaceae bacterium]